MDQSTCKNSAGRMRKWRQKQKEVDPDFQKK